MINLIMRNITSILSVAIRITGSIIIKIEKIKMKKKEG